MIERVEYRKSVDVNYECDVLVLGGGIAGVCAACAAAAEGASVLLIEQYGITGGNCTSGGVAAFCGETSGQGRIFDEMIRRLEAFHAVEPYRPYQAKELGEARTFHHHILAFVLQEMLLAHGVRILLHTRFLDVMVADSGRITECLIEGKSGIEAVRAKTVIDATGDGDVADRAGFSTMKGAPGSGIQLPMSMMFFVKYIGSREAAQGLPEGYFERLSGEEQLPMVSVWPNGNDGRAIKVKIPGYDATNTESLTQAELYARRRCMQILDYMQRADPLVLFDHTRLGEDGRLCFGKGRRELQQDGVVYDSCSPQIGIREGRRIRGDYVLTVEDVRRSAVFEDAVARGTFYLDVHSSKDDKRSYAVDTSTMYTEPYQIPLRALIAQDGENLLMAGRCFSCDQQALGTARVTTTCAMLGQAAGITAAMAAQSGKRIRDVDPAVVRRMLEGYGARLEIAWE